MDAIRRNLDTVDRHIRGEAVDVDSILGLYTDDIVLEIPGRGLRFEGREAIRANYLRMWGSMRGGLICREQVFELWRPL